MNPFEDNSTNDNTSTKPTLIEIWVETNGRKKNTYISGWNIPEEQLKEHLKTIKKKNGCNGTIKEIPNETNTELLKVLQLQGDHSEYINQYLITHSIDPNNIRTKG
jgi:translation initiation factor 1 (eIF-1/SUI1)